MNSFQKHVSLEGGILTWHYDQKGQVFVAEYYPRQDNTRLVFEGVSTSLSSSIGLALLAFHEGSRIIRKADYPTPSENMSRSKG